MSNYDNDSEESVLGNLHAPMVLKEEDLRRFRAGSLGEGIPSKKKESSQQPGKELCKILRQIRVEIARNNGIPFWSEECQFDGPCKGTCPKCDAEIRYLTEELEKKKAKGEQVVLTQQEHLDLDRINRRPVNSRPSHDSDADGSPEESLLEMGQDDMNDVRNWTIDNLELSVRTYNCLIRHGIYTVNDLLQCSLNKLMKVRNLGRRSREEIIMKLQELDLELPPDE